MFLYFMTKRETQINSNHEFKIHKKLQIKKTKKRRDKIHNYNIINFFKCLCLNYKIVVLLLVCCGYFSCPNIYFGYISLVYTNFISYMFHVLSHVSKISILNKLHLYHHTHNTLFGYFTEFIFEIVTFLVIPIIIKYAFYLTFINEYVLLFTFLIFTSVHLVNYSYIHVNHSHEKHHAQVHLNLPNIKHNHKVSNFGPVYMDVLFGTNYKPYKQCENYDHAILNTLFSFCFVFILKYLWENPQNQPFMSFIYKNVMVIFIIIYLLLYVIL